MRKLIIWKLCLLMALMPLRPWALSQSDASYWNMNRALSGVTQEAIQARGFAPTDPRIHGTLQGMGSAAIGTASTAAGVVGGAGVVTLAGLTAPAWASVVLFATVSAVIGFGVNLALNGLVNWLFRSDKKIDANAAAASVDPSGGITAGGSTWRASDNVNWIYGGDFSAVGNQARYNIALRSNQTANFSPVTCTQNSPTLASCGSISVAFQPDGAPGTCPAGHFWILGSCSSYGFAAGGSYSAQTLQQAVDRLSAAERAKPLNPQLVAAVANQLWQQAASVPGYQGLPYPQSNPITTAEAQAWQTAHADKWPTVGDFVSPVATGEPGAYSMPVNATSSTVNPATGTNPNTSNPSTQPQINIGPDPGIGAPTLEATPTAAQILEPILGLMPELRAFNAGSHTSVCPRPTLHLFGETQTMEAHCILLEDNKAVIQAAMALAWALLALLIILSA